MDKDGAVISVLMTSENYLGNDTKTGCWRYIDSESTIKVTAETVFSSEGSTEFASPAEEHNHSHAVEENSASGGACALSLQSLKLRYKQLKGRPPRGSLASDANWLQDQIEQFQEQGPETRSRGRVPPPAVASLTELSRTSAPRIEKKSRSQPVPKYISHVAAENTAVSVNGGVYKVKVSQKPFGMHYKGDRHMMYSGATYIIL
jgi:hypothetical protein